MGLLDSIMGSLSNSNSGGGDLGGILKGLQALGGQQGAGADDMQAVVAALGTHVKSGLRNIEQSPTPETAAQFADELAAQDQASPDMISKLLGSDDSGAVAQAVSQRTGLGIDKIMAMLPIVLPIVMKLLRSGGGQAAAGAPASSGASAGSGAGGLLEGFLDSDNDGDVDLQDVLKLAAKFK